MKVLKPKDLKPLVLTSTAQAEELIKKYEAIDAPKASAVMFAHHLLQRRDSYFVSAGDEGLIYLTDVVPEFCGSANVVFWDQRLTGNRRELCQTVLQHAFKKFALQRISAAAPVSNHPLQNFWRKCGFVREGCLRRMWASKPPTDLIVYGMLPEELSCLVLPTTSLE